MEAENLKKEVHFIGDVTVKRVADRLRADKVIVYFDDFNQTKMYKALGNVRFEFNNAKNSYKGYANSITYYPITSIYVLSGRAWIDDEKNKRHINGEMITLDIKKGNIEVKGNAKKPVKFIFDMEKQ
jgi:lipopolysaccharide export system protein LptA